MIEKICFIECFLYTALLINKVGCGKILYNGIILSKNRRLVALSQYGRLENGVKGDINIYSINCVYVFNTANHY
ncbi:MAG: hypothetical protein J6F30_03215 [Cellulosilyticum sp.]|nr:hypothetical protein [Cellulosilyticum sp.]